MVFLMIENNDETETLANRSCFRNQL